MKKILFIILFLGFNTCFSAIDDYFDIEYVSTNYTGISKSNDSTVYICGWYGCIMMSKDMGKTWEKLNTKSNDYLMSIASYDNTIISTGIEGTIIYSNDSGKNWNKSKIQTTETLNSNILFNSNEGIVFGNSGLIMKTSNGGLTWSTITIGTGDNIVDAIQIPSGAIFIATVTGKIFKSDDLGNNWSELSTPEIVFSPSNFSYTFDNILYLSSNNYVLKSTDEGNSWIAFDNPVKQTNFCSFVNEGVGFLFGNMSGLTVFEVNNDSSIVNSNKLGSSISPASGTSIQKILFTDENNGIAIADNNFIAITSDKGETWNIISYLNGFRNSGYKDLFFFNDSTGFISSDNENLYKTTNGGTTWNFIKKDSNRKSNTPIDQIFFFNESKGIMLSDAFHGGIILKTYDGGLTVTKENINELNGAWPTFINVKSDTFCFNGNRWFYNTWHNYLSFRNFEGKWWNTSIIDSAHLSSPYTFNWKNIYRCGLFLDSSLPVMHYRGLIVHSIDSGKNWQKIFFDSVANIERIKMLNDSTLLAYGTIKHYHSDSIIYKTTNSGRTWVKLDTSLFFKLANLKSPNENYIMESMEDKYYFSINGGKDKEKFQLMKAFHFGRIFTTKHCFYALGKIGTDYPLVLKFKLKDITDVKENQTETLPAPLIWMFNPFPHPARNYVNFNIIWDKRYSTSDMKINIYNFDGEKIIKPKYEINQNGENTAVIKLYLSNFSNGLYIVEIELGGYKRIRKVIVVK